MKKMDTGTRNIGFYAVMLATYTAALPMVNGALMQLFLADRGLGTVQIGTYSTIVQLTTLLGTMTFSKIADRSENPLRFTGFVVLFQLLAYLAYFPMTRVQLSAGTTLLIMIGLAVIQTASSSLKGVLDYKLPYQIVPLNRYGGMIFFNSAVNGVVGIGLSFCFSQIIAQRPMGIPYLWCMVLALGLMITSLICCSRIKPLEVSTSILHKNPMSTRQLLDMFRSVKFRAIVIPTMLRGITFGITASIVLIMLNMGYTEAEASKIPMITALGCLVSAGVYHLLSNKVKMPNIGIIGSVMLLAMVFLPRGNMVLFSALYLVAYTGQILMDCTIPIMIVQIVDPDIAGAFNAWRNTLLFLVSTATTYISSLLLARGMTLVVLIACAAAYAISMVLHKRVYYRFTGANR